MAGREDAFKGINIGTYEDNEWQLLAQDFKKYINGDVVFFCIGTDRSTGDSFAPFIGTFLKEKGYENVIGTIDDPVHAENIEERMKEIPEGKTVVAIDACMGRMKNIGKVKFNSGVLHPGAGLDKDLPPVGDYSILGVVQISHPDLHDRFNLLACTRLSRVLKMAKQCVSAIEMAFPLNEVSNNSNKIINVKGVM